MCRCLYDGVMFYLIRVGKSLRMGSFCTRKNSENKSVLFSKIRIFLKMSLFLFADWEKCSFCEKNHNFGEKDRFFVSLFFAEWGVSGEMLVLGIPGNDSHQLSVYRAGEFIFGLSLSYRFDVLIVGCQSSLTKITRKRQDFFPYFLKYRIFWEKWVNY